MSRASHRWFASPPAPASAQSCLLTALLPQPGPQAAACREAATGAAAGGIAAGADATFSAIFGAGSDFSATLASGFALGLVWRRVLFGLDVDCGRFNFGCLRIRRLHLRSLSFRLGCLDFFRAMPRARFARMSAAQSHSPCLPQACHQAGQPAHSVTARRGPCDGAFPSSKPISTI